jgi:hypothetical protein
MRKFTSGMYTCPACFLDVCTTSTLGKQPREMALERMANAPDSMAWLAMMAAKMATMNVGQNIGAENYQMKKIRSTQPVKRSGSKLVMSIRSISLY